MGGAVDFREWCEGYRERLRGCGQLGIFGGIDGLARVPSIDDARLDDGTHDISERVGAAGFGDQPPSVVLRVNRGRNVEIEFLGHGRQ